MPHPLPLAVLIPAPGISLLYGSKVAVLELWSEPQTGGGAVSPKFREINSSNEDNIEDGPALGF